MKLYLKTIEDGNKADVKLKNAGFSLLEILVAITILAIVTLPILSTFSSSAKMNLTAKRTENATTTAQKISESFKARSLISFASAGNNAGNEYEVYNSLGVASYKVLQEKKNGVEYKKYQFNMCSYKDGTTSGEENALFETDADGDKHPYCIGTDGERFFVDVDLTPKGYNDSDSNTSNNINSYVYPQYDNINSAYNYTCLDQIYYYDNAIANTYAADKEKIVKKVECHVYVEKQLADTYIQRFVLNVKYELNGSVLQNYEFNDFETPPFTSGQLSSQGGFNGVYIFYTMYDRYNTGGVSSDEVTVYYHLPDGGMDQKLNVYLIQQDGIKNYTSSTTYMKLDENKIKVVYQTNSGGILPDSSISSLYKNVGFFSNVSNTYKRPTEANAHPQDILYDMTITVRYGTYDSEPMMVITSTKEDW